MKDDLKRDRRWVTVKRPAIVLGAEMDREALDLGYDPTARFYQAPPHIKAQNGALIIDDFGRQQIPTRDLLTRWLIPMERGWDSLTLVTGEKLVVPFKVQLLFSTNLRVKDLADEALLRRILYKIQIPNPDRDNFAEILRQACRQKQDQGGGGRARLRRRQDVRAPGPEAARLLRPRHPRHHDRERFIRRQGADLRPRIVRPRLPAVRHPRGGRRRRRRRRPAGA